MHISVNWLNRYLSPGGLNAEAVERALMDAGFPIETREPLPDGDTRLDVEITSNRGDCLSHLGLAREVAAKTGHAMKGPSWSDPAPGGKIGEVLKLTNAEHAVCPLFTARVIRGVRVGPSPAWLVKALESVGQRSINNVVDVTNYITFEFGNPCHVFDLKKMAGGAIVVRYARDKESLTTLDGRKRELRKDELVVADAERAQSLAGVMGGADSEVGPETVDVILEMATWDPVTVRRAARRLGIRTDASYRFERIVDARTIDEASRRAAALIVEVAGGKLCEGSLSVGKELASPTTVRFRPSRCEGLMGITVKSDEMVRLLSAVGIGVEPVGRAGEELRCTIPAWRPDLYREVDLIEEVARLKGLEHIPILEKLPVTVHAPQLKERAQRELGGLLTGLGFFETVTFSFVTPGQAEIFRVNGVELIRIDDERRKAEPVLRPSVLPSLLACRRKNQDGRVHQPGGVRLYETASVFGEAELPHDEQERAGFVPGPRRQTIENRNLALIADVCEPGARAGIAEKQLAVRQMRGVIEAVVHLLGGATDDLVVTPGVAPWKAFDAGATALLSLGATPLGCMGLFSQAALNEFGLDAPVVGAEVNLGALLGLYPPKAKVTPLPAFPGTDRDLSLIVPETVTWAVIKQRVETAKLPWLEATEFVTTYRGKQTGAGQKSVTLRLLFRDAHRTLRSEEIDPHVEGLVKVLKEQLGAEVRSAG